MLLLLLLLLLLLMLYVSLNKHLLIETDERLVGI